MPNILIVGFGVVGKNLNKELQKLSPDIYDKYKPQFNTKRDIKYDVAFICVDTPMDADGQYLVISDVVSAIRETNADIYVIKSTMPVFKTELIADALHKKLVYSPEYYGSTQHCNNFDYNFTILGGNIEDCKKVQQILQGCYDASHTFRITDSNTAELAKLMENSWLATKVTFCTQFYEICQKYDINYEELRELFILDPRVHPSHTFVYSDHPFWDSHCLNKDVVSFANKAEAEFLQSVVKYNNEQKKRYGSTKG